MRRAAFREQLVYWMYRGLSEVGLHAPAAVTWIVSKVAVGIAWRSAPARRELIRRHLSRISGGALSGPDLERAMRASYESYRRYWVDSSRVAGRSGAELERRASGEGFDHIDAALAQGRGAILALPHIGNWDEGGAWMASVGYPLTVVAEELEPPRLFEYFVAQRRAVGITAVPLGPAAAGAVSTTLRAGGLVALLCDRDVGGTGVEVDFFGEVTRLPAGPALLALRTGAKLLPAAVYLREGGIHARVLPPVPAERSSGPLRDDIVRVTQSIARQLEELIRAAPEQWHVFQPNWPSDPGYGGTKDSES